jgi:hypothetical protein
MVDSLVQEGLFWQRFGKGFWYCGIGKRGEEFYRDAGDEGDGKKGMAAIYPPLTPPWEGGVGQKKLQG